MRYFIQLAYDGTHYSGWQVQPNAPTVQETLNTTIGKLLRRRISSMGCGRTDTGVHAKDFYMHLDLEEPLADPEGFTFRLNGALPRDISVFRTIPVADKAHSRFDATARTYEYYIHFARDPFLDKYSLHQGYYPLDWELIAEATAFLKGIEDFSALCLKSEDFKTNICRIDAIGWEEIPSVSYGAAARGETQMRLTITANRFLRGMVRKIVGTLLMVGKKKISVEEFKEVVKEKKSFRIALSAPPHGLFLSHIQYPYPL